jgi:hypothetical protein
MRVLIVAPDSHVRAVGDFEIRITSAKGYALAPDFDPFKGGG